YADPDRDRTNRAGIAAIDAGLAGEDALADDVALQLEEHALDLLAGPFGAVTAGERSDCLRLDLRETRMPLLLLRDRIGLRKRRLRVQRDGAAQIGVVGLGLPAPARLARLGGQLADRADGNLHLLVSEHNRAEHDLLREPLGFGFDHQHRVYGTRHDQMQHRLGELARRRIQQILAVLPADARGA